MRDPVKRMAQAMEAKLKEHDAKKGTEGWLTMTIDELLDGLLSELNNFELAHGDGKKERAKEEIIGVANFAMMIYDCLTY